MSQAVQAPPQPHLSGISLSGIDHIDGNQLPAVISQIEQYSKSLVANFESTVKQVKERLDRGGSVALLAMEKLSNQRDAFDKMINEHYSQLEAIMNEVEAVVDSMSGLDTIQAQVNELYDTIVTVEQFVRNPV